MQLSSSITSSRKSELSHSVTATVTKVVTREKVSALRQARESPPPQKKRQVVVDSELRKRCVDLRDMNADADGECLTPNDVQFHAPLPTDLPEQVGEEDLQTPVWVRS